MRALSFLLKIKWLDSLAVFAAGAVLVWIATFQYLGSDFLYQDDPIFVGAQLFRENTLMPKNALNLWIIGVLSTFSSLLIVKSYISLTVAAVFGCFYFIVSRLSGLRWAAVALAVISVFYPVSVDQSFFVSGGHPTAATAAFFVYLILLLQQLERGLQAGAGFNLGVAALQAIVLYTCAMISPTYNLAPFLLLISTAVYLVSEKAWRDPIRMRIGLGLQSIAILLAALQIGNLNSNHYAGIPGWVSYSLGGMLSNLQTALEMIVVDPLEGRPAITALYIVWIVGLTALFGFALLRSRASGGDSAGFNARRRTAIAMGIVLTVSSALLFGPSSVVTAFLSRYVVASYFSGTLALALLVSVGLAALRGRHGLVRPAANFLLLAAAVLVATHYVISTRDALRPLLASHNLVAEALRGRSWKPDDQILILLPDDRAETSLGFNHWSTWQIRIITGQRDIIGLIGRESRLAELQENGLFVDRYSDHSDAYWRTVNGRGRRLRMVGLERGRALYAFKPDDHGGLVPATVSIWEGNSIAVIPFGGRIGNQSSDAPLDRLCQTVTDGAGLFIALNPAPPEMNAFDVIMNRSFSFDGSQERGVQIDVAGSDFAYISFQLARKRDQPHQPAQEYGDAYPPMPLLSQDLAIYDLPGQMQVVGRTSEMKASAPLGDADALKLTLLGCPGKAGLVFLNDAFAGALSEAKFSGVWRFGKGFKERYWRGDVRDFRVGVSKREAGAE